MTVGPLVVQQVEVAVLPTYGNMGSWFRMETGQSKLHKVKGNIKYKYELNLLGNHCLLHHRFQNTWTNFNTWALYWLIGIAQEEFEMT